MTDATPRKNQPEKSRETTRAENNEAARVALKRMLELLGTPL